MDRSRIEPIFARLTALDPAGVAAVFADDGVLVLGGDPPVRGRAAIERAVGEALALVTSLEQRVIGLWEISGGFVREAEVRYRLRGSGSATVPEVAVMRTHGDQIRELRMYRDPTQLNALRAARGSSGETVVRHEERGVRGTFYVMQDGRRVGELAYTAAGPGLMVIDHTEVGPELRGRGAGLRLVEAAVRHARSTGRKLLPLCPYARAALADTRDLQDVVARG